MGPVVDPLASVRASVRTLLSDHPDGHPPWVAALAVGDRDCLVPPDGAAWAVHGSLPTLVGGVRALLLQALHPLPAAAVRQHSSYATDPLGRLQRTARWLTVSTFGDVASAERASAGVRKLHESVVGTAADGRDYAAADPRLLLWVHCAFTDSFLTAHEALGGRPIPGGADAYIREWAATARLLGVDDPPQSRQELAAALEDYRGAELGRGSDTAALLEFLRRPPLPRAQVLAYRVLFDAATELLDPRDRELLGLRPPGRTAIPKTRALLAGLGLALGPTAPAMEAARERLEGPDRPSSLG